MSQQELELPQGWIDTTVEHCVNILDGKRIPINSKERAKRIGKIPYYGATGQTGWIDNFIFNEELVLIGEDGAPFLDFTKDTAYIISGKSWVNNHAHVVRAIDELTSNQFLCHYLNIFDYHEFISGTTRMKLNQLSLKIMPVFLPPLNEQKRIVSKIEELFSKIDSAKQSMEHAKLQLEQYRQSLLKSAFEGKNTEKWESVKLESITEKIVNTNPKDNPDHKFKYCDIASIDNTNHIIVNPKNFLGKDAPSRARQIIHQDDIIFSTVRTYLHNFAIVPSDLNNQLCSTGFCVLRGDDSIITKLIFYLVQTIQFENYLNPLQRGTSYPAVRNNDILNYKFLLPPLEEQQQIVSQIEQGFSLIENTSQIVESTLQKLQTMKTSVLKQAFEGKLVSQDPNDEPASVLLERIKSTKESRSTKQRGMKNVK